MTARAVRARADRRSRRTRRQGRDRGSPWSSSRMTSGSSCAAQAISTGQTVRGQARRSRHEAIRGRTARRQRAMSSGGAPVGPPMATFVLLPGAASDALVLAPRRAAAARRPGIARSPSTCRATTTRRVRRVRRRRRRGDRAAGDGADELVLVAQSMAGFTAPIVATRVPGRDDRARRGDDAGAGRVGRRLVDEHRLQARPIGEAMAALGLPTEPFDEAAVFLHDVPADVVAAVRGPPQGRSPARRSRRRGRSPPGPTSRPGSCCAATTACSRAAFQRRVVGERLGIVPDEMAGGHLPALAHPAELADHLLRTSPTCTRSPDATGAVPPSGRDPFLGGIRPGSRDDPRPETIPAQMWDGAELRRVRGRTGRCRRGPRWRPPRRRPRGRRSSPSSTSSGRGRRRGGARPGNPAAAASGPPSRRPDRHQPGDAATRRRCAVRTRSGTSATGQPPLPCSPVVSTCTSTGRAGRPPGDLGDEARPVDGLPDVDRRRPAGAPCSSAAGR